MTSDSWPADDPTSAEMLSAVWIPVGVPGFSGVAKADRVATLDARVGMDGWRFAHVVRGQVVPFEVAIAEYEEAYRQFLRGTPALVHFLVTPCGNVYDDNVTNVHDADYAQPHTAMNHYQDISVRRVIAELVDDPDWPDVIDTGTDDADLLDLGTGKVEHVPRSRGMRGGYLFQIRDPLSPGFCLNPAVVPVHDPALITTLPGRDEWYHVEGCAHLSVEAFWQMSKVVEVRYDRFLALGDDRVRPLDGV